MKLKIFTIFFELDSNQSSLAVISVDSAHDIDGN